MLYGNNRSCHPECSISLTVPKLLLRIWWKTVHNNYKPWKLYTKILFSVFVRFLRLRVFLLLFFVCDSCWTGFCFCYCVMLHFVHFGYIYFVCFPFVLFHSLKRIMSVLLPFKFLHTSIPLSVAHRLWIMV